MKKYLLVCLLVVFAACSNSNNNEPAIPGVTFADTETLQVTRLDKISITLVVTGDAMLRINDVNFYVNDQLLEYVMFGDHKYTIYVGQIKQSGAIVLKSEQGKVLATGPYVNLKKAYLSAYASKSDYLIFNSPAMCRYNDNEVLFWSSGKKQLSIVSFDKLEFKTEDCLGLELNKESSSFDNIPDSKDYVYYVPSGSIGRFGLAAHNGRLFIYQPYRSKDDGIINKLLYAEGWNSKTTVYLSEDVPEQAYGKINAIAVDSRFNVYTSEDGKPYIQETIGGIANPVIFAGSEQPGHQDGKGREAQFSAIRDMVMGKDGNLYVADGNCVRMVASDGTVSTLVGAEEAGDKIGDASSARFNHIKALSITNDGTLYILDGGSNTIRTLSADRKTVDKLGLQETHKYDKDYTGMVVTENGVIYTISYTTGASYFYLFVYVPEELVPTDFKWGCNVLEW